MAICPGLDRPSPVEIVMDTEKLKREAAQVYLEAELLYSVDKVEASIEQMAKDITAVLAETNPVVLCPMIGAIVPVGKLLPLLDFQLQLEYIHATRYRGDTTGGTLYWLRKPAIPLRDRTVLIVDDILDKGTTLGAIVDECKKLRAAKIYTAVLVDKQTEKTGTIKKADFTGLTVPDRYVFGYGMDYKEYLRNCAGIYAVKKS